MKSRRGGDRHPQFPRLLYALSNNCGVELRQDLQARQSRGRRDEVDNDLVADEGFTAPVLAYEGNRRCSIFVLFTGAWRKV